MHFEFKLMLNPVTDWDAIGLLINQVVPKRISKLNGVIGAQKALKLLTELAGNRDNLTPQVLSQIHITGVLVCEDYILAEVLACAANLKFLGCSPPGKEGLIVGVLTGDLNAWRDSVVSGLSNDTSRDVYLRVYRAFGEAGYSKVWSAYREVIRSSGLTLEIKK